MRPIRETDRAPEPNGFRLVWDERFLEIEIAAVRPGQLRADLVSSIEQGVALLANPGEDRPTTRGFAEAFR